ncbi:MAG: hypothetical protein FJ115_02775 [Deltaproteobacteria bacterium]|nr:hypothetical protein [Deltaproteobacteria bacterium]
MRMGRRKLLKIALITAGAVVAGGGTIYVINRKSRPLGDHFDGTRKVLISRFGKERATQLIEAISKEYEILAPQMPYIGGEENMFTEWLIYGVYYLAVYRILKGQGQTSEEVGKVIYDAFKAMADHPKWLLRLIGGLKYNNRYVNRLREAVRETQKHRYPGDWVAEFIEGDGKTFDYGLDIKECGICKYYHAQGAGELAPYLCLSDCVVSEAFDRGLVRFKTLAEGTDVCDFRYKKGRETYVHPLRNGWPPRFSREKI